MHWCREYGLSVLEKKIRHSVLDETTKGLQVDRADNYSWADSWDTFKIKSQETKKKPEETDGVVSESG